MNIKQVFLSALTASLILVSQTAHADFRKALDAYMARDGDTMLKEVKDAVDKKNDGGLILFISATDIDYTTSRMSSFEPEPKPKKIDLSIVKSTWETILTEAQQKELFDLLDVATSKARVEARYKLIHSAIYLKYKELTNQPHGLDSELAILANKGSASAAYELYVESENADSRYKWLSKAAINGSANAAYELAIFCYGGERNTDLQKLSECKNKNEEKLFFWLKKALENDDSYWVRGLLASEFGKLYLKGFINQAPDVKEAYLWALIAVNNNGDSVFEDSILGKIHKMGLLKQVDPILGATLDENWENEDKRRELVQMKEMPALPILLMQLSKVPDKKPIFSFRSTATTRLPVSKRQYLPVGVHDVDVYADGRVNLNFGYIDSRKENVETILKLTPRQLQQFIADVQILDMPSMFNNPKGCSQDWECLNLISYSILDRTGKTEKSYRVSLFYINQLTPINLNKKAFYKITTLIEKYIPTQKLRCSLGSSKTYCQDCLNFYDKLSKAEK